MDALTVIRSEHRTISAVVQCLDVLQMELDDAAIEPDFELLSAIVDYIEAFPDTFHHPKEDDYLFKALYRRSPELRETLDGLKEEHQRCYTMIVGLREALRTFQAHPASGREPFQQAAREYVDFQNRHLAREENEILPEARRALTESDWHEIDRAFADNEDPLFGAEPQERFRKLFTRIVNLAPAPLGLGQPQEH